MGEHEERKRGTVYATLGRVPFLCVHSIVHVLFYLLPYAFGLLFVSWPAYGIGWLSGSRPRFPTWREKASVKVIAHSVQRAALNDFGLEGSQLHRIHSSPNVVGNSDDEVPTVPVGLCYNGPLYSGHIHTILGAFRLFSKVSFQREVLASFDGNSVCLDFLYPSRSGTAHTGACPRAFALILPGLMGSSKEVYVRRMAFFLSQHGVAVAVLNARGVGDTPLEKPQIFCALFTSDLRHVLQHYLRREQVQERLHSEKPVPIVGVAFSLGGVILSNYLGEQGMQKEASGLDAAYTITSPHHLSDGDIAMHRPLTKILYRSAFYSSLKAYYERHADIFHTLPGIQHNRLFEQPVPLIKTLRTIRDFDEHITAPHFGFSGADAYYLAASNFNQFGHSTTPQMCIVSADDPVCGRPQRHKCWESAVQSNSNLVYVEMPVGGHLGFVDTPVNEFLARPNPMELFVLRSVTHFINERDTSRAKRADSTHVN